MQVENEHNIENRTDIYGAKTISRHFQKGEDYKNAKQVIMIDILNYEFLGFEEYISETVTVLDKHRDYQMNSILKKYYIELPKFRKANPDMNDKLNQWLAFIDDEDRGKIKLAEEKNDVLKQARIEMNYLTGDAEVRRLAELKDKWESDWNSSMNWARREGEINGERKGEIKGRKQEQTKMIKKLLERKMSIEDIAEITGLTKEEILEFKEKN